MSRSGTCGWRARPRSTRPTGADDARAPGRRSGAREAPCSGARASWAGRGKQAFAGDAPDPHAQGAPVRPLCAWEALGCCVRARERLARGGKPACMVWHETRTRKLRSEAFSALRMRRSAVSVLGGALELGPASRQVHWGHGADLAHRAPHPVASGAPQGPPGGLKLPRGLVARLDPRWRCPGPGRPRTALGRATSRSCGRARRPAVRGGDPARGYRLRRHRAPKLAI